MSDDTIFLEHYMIKGNVVQFLGQADYLTFDSPVDLNNSIHRNTLIDYGVIINKKKICDQKIKSDHNLLVLEPHPDDFAFSSSGLIIEELSKNSKVSALNIFSRASLKTFPWNDRISISEQDYERLRLYESRTACYYLNITFDTLGLSLATKRGHSSPFEKINSDDLDLAETLYSILEKKVVEDEITHLVAPLGVGGHVDHIITFETSLMLKKKYPSLNVILYEDMPYSRSNVDLISRKKQVSSLVPLLPYDVSIDDFLDQMADLIAIYKSQLDDVTRKEALDMLKIDTLNQKTGLSTNTSSYIQRYYAVMTQ